jgi:hypothetical protein
MLSLKEGIFSDMVTKTKVPLCRAAETDASSTNIMWTRMVVLNDP